MKDYYDGRYLRYAMRKNDDFLAIEGFLAKFQLSSARVIDICGGFGRVAVFLAAQGNRVHVIDAGAKIVGAGREWVRRSHAALHGRVTYEVMDCRETLNVAMQSRFDLALCAHNAINELTEEPDPVFRCAAQALMPGGVLLLQALARNWEPQDAIIRPRRWGSDVDGSNPALAASERLTCDTHLLRTIYLSDSSKSSLPDDVRTLVRRYWPAERLDRAARKLNFTLVAQETEGFLVYRFVD